VIRDAGGSRDAGGGRDAGDIYYLPAFYQSETGAARFIARIAGTAGILSSKGENDKNAVAMQNKADTAQSKAEAAQSKAETAQSKAEAALLARIDEGIRWAEASASVEYDEVQKDAVKSALTHRFMVLTGGPGTGKTTTTAAIISICERLGARVLLAAPTGRAAKRMSEATGREAKTIHRLLEIKPPADYARNAENPLNCDVLIIDEASMLDIILAYHLLKAVPPEASVIFVGDVDQLPSVGPGSVLRDIIDSKVVCTVHLSRIFRQAQNSDIVKNAHMVNAGIVPKKENRADTDFFFTEKDTPAEIAETIIGLCKDRLPNFLGVNAFEDIQVLCPMTKGETGTISLNEALQAALNKNEEKIRYGLNVYKLGDKVMQIRNNYEKTVFNGDIGTISSIDNETRTLAIRFDGTDIEYDVSELDEVALAYAVTVHKSQGSEYPVVVCPLSMQHYIMLQRNLIYTAITRAKRALVLVGTRKALSIAVRNKKSAARNTMLAARLREIFGKM